MIYLVAGDEGEVEDYPEQERVHLGADDGPAIVLFVVEEVAIAELYILNMLTWAMTATQCILCKNGQQIYKYACMKVTYPPFFQKLYVNLTPQREISTHSTKRRS